MSSSGLQNGIVFFTSFHKNFESGLESTAINSHKEQKIYSPLKYFENMQYFLGFKT